MFIVQFVRGFVMALADSVPGVSGGTIAFLLGFYDRFISSIDDLLTGKMEKKKDALIFLVKLVIGWVCGMIVAILILSQVFESHIYAVSSLFLGFIIVAIPIVAYGERKTLASKKVGILFTVIGIAVVVLITYFNPATGSDGVSLAHLSVGMGLFVFVAGVVAIATMVLPGISGSTLLLIMGLYVPIVTAVKSVLTLDFSVLPAVVIFACGVIVGIFAVVKVIRKALERFRPQMIYLIIGLMIGSLYAVVMGPTTLDVPQAAMNIHSFRILFFVIGVALIVLLQLWQWMRGNKKDK